jgi:hypothetical protein
MELKAPTTITKLGSGGGFELQPCNDSQASAPVPYGPDTCQAERRCMAGLWFPGAW